MDLIIAGIRLRITSDQPIKGSDAFAPFLQAFETPDICLSFRQVDALPSHSEQVIYEDLCYRVHPDGKGGYVRTFFDPPRDYEAYALATYDYGGGIVQVDYLPKGAHCVSELSNCMFHLGLEALLIHQHRLCLHASCIDTPLGGILFSGVSGIGKSTQANLWCQHRDAKQINGDRPILTKGSDGWMAWGSPYAGSSKVHVNDSCSITAIVMLKQAQECSLRRLSLPEAFRSVWSGLTMHSWNEKLVELASNLTVDLVSAVPVFEFGCTPDEAAVRYLEKELGKECCL